MQPTADLQGPRGLGLQASPEARESRGPEIDKSTNSWLHSGISPHLWRTGHRIHVVSMILRVLGITLSD